MQNVHSIQPIPNRAGVDPGQLQFHFLYAPSVLAVLGPQEAIQLVTQRAREVQNDQPETARRALLHQAGEFLAATHQYEAAAKRNFVNTLTKKKRSTQLQRFRQLEHEADARFSQRPRELLSRFSQEANQALDNQKYGGETNKYMIYVQNTVTTHYTRKTLRNNKVKNTLETSAFDRNTSISRDGRRISSLSISHWSRN